MCDKLCYVWYDLDNGTVQKIEPLYRMDQFLLVFYITVIDDIVAET